MNSFKNRMKAWCWQKLQKKKVQPMTQPCWVGLGVMVLGAMVQHTNALPDVLGLTASLLLELYRSKPWASDEEIKLLMSRLAWIILVQTDCKSSQLRPPRCTQRLLAAGGKAARQRCLWCRENTAATGFRVPLPSWKALCDLKCIAPIVVWFFCFC